MIYNEAVDYLYNLQKYGIKFGLENITRLMSHFGNPHKAFLSIHIAGTNGKGSTAAAVSSVLQAAGCKVGLFTSPHLVNFTERIRVNGEEISEEEVIGLAGEVKKAVENMDNFSPTFFEVVTTIAMLYFEREKVDIAVIEVGMGGRLDATSIISPEVSVITHVSYDHEDFLGRSLKEIAYEKAGIVKHGIPVVTAAQEAEAEEIITAVSREKKSPLYKYGRDFEGILKSSDTHGLVFSYSDRSGKRNFRDLFMPLAGEHQLINSCLAIKTATIVIEKYYESSLFSRENPIFREREGTERAIAPDDRQSFIYQKIKEGLKNLLWRGRLELVGGRIPILLDGAHNPAAAIVLSKSLKEIYMKRYKKLIMVLGIMSDKDIKGIMQPLLPLASDIILTSPAYERAAPPAKLAEIAKSLGIFNPIVVPGVKDSIEIAEIKALSTPGSSLIVISGSFYTIGEAKEILGSKGILARLRE
ncbi:MAG: folylpolyglutamate synthase/dihydrofolate synthase family protein [Nitrospirota bacterium]